MGKAKVDSLTLTEQFLTVSGRMTGFTEPEPACSRAGTVTRDHGIMGELTGTVSCRTRTEMSMRVNGLMVKCTAEVYTGMRRGMCIPENGGKTAGTVRVPLRT